MRTGEMAEQPGPVPGSAEKTTTGTAASVAALSRALSATERVVAMVRGEQWVAPTGCPGWDVRALLNHLVAGNQFVAAALTDQSAPDWSVDHLGADPLGAYRGAAAAVQAAFAEPGSLDKVVAVPFGTVPGAVALHLRITEILVHGWDLAHATGQPSSGLPADLADQELEFSRGALGDIPADRRPFAPAQPVDDDAPAIDRLAALLGRPVTSRTPETSQ